MYKLDIKIGCLLFRSVYNTIEEVWEHISYRKETEHSFSYTIKNINDEVEAQGDFSIDIKKEQLSACDFYINTI